MSHTTLTLRRCFVAVVSLVLIALGACRDEPTNPGAKNGEQPPTTAPPTITMPNINASLLDGESYTQVINNAPGMNEYRYYYADFGWTHTFPLWNTPGLTITSARLIVSAWDVDAETWHGWDGEYDRLYVDGQPLDPGYLQGTNGTWSVTTFDVPVGRITDDGNVNVWLDIDMHHNSMVWATTISSSQLVITYTTGPVNGAPYQPTLSGAPATVVSDDDDMIITVTGPSPADPDNDPVTYAYRWFVNVGTGAFLDPSFVGRGTFTGNTIPASATVVGDIWRVNVTPQDDKDAVGNYAVYTFPQVTRVVDPSPPVISATVTGTSGANGWYTSDVSIVWSVTDAQSPITAQSGCDAVTLTNNTAGQTYTCTATSGGGTATQSVTVKIDKTPPTLTPAPAGPLGTNGWYVGDVTISFTASDDISPVGSVESCAATLTTDTNAQAYNCSVTNEAGLSTSASITVKRDATKPVITPEVNGPLGLGNWYVGDVTVGFTVTDATSGVVSPACAGGTLTIDAANQTYDCSATDAAGNTAAASVSVKRDATKPVLTFVGYAESFTVDQSVNITCTFQDVMSGLNQQVCNGVSREGYELPLGLNTVSALANDFAGNEATLNASFQVLVAEANICTLVKRWVTNAGVANSLCQKLDAANAAGLRGNTNAHVNILDAFISEVTAQAGGKVPADKAPILIRLANALK